MNKLVLLILVCMSYLTPFCAFTHETAPLESMTFKNPNQPFDEIITGGQPSVIDLDKLKNLNVKNIINLRSSDEFDEYNEQKESEERGLNYYSLAISGANDINIENAIKLDNILRSLQGKSFVHCASSNRVGALMAIREFVIHKKTKEEALEVGQKAGLGSLYQKTEDVLNNLNLD